MDCPSPTDHSPSTDELGRPRQTHVLPTDETVKHVCCPFGCERSTSGFQTEDILSSPLKQPLHTRLSPTQAAPQHPMQAPPTRKPHPRRYLAMFEGRQNTLGFRSIVKLRKCCQVEIMLMFFNEKENGCRMERTRSNRSNNERVYKSMISVLIVTEFSLSIGSYDAVKPMELYPVFCQYTVIFFLRN